MTLTLAAAQAALVTALDEARKLDLAVAAVVVDQGGFVVASARMDGVSHAVFDLARRKASTAAAFGERTQTFAENVGGDATLSSALATSPDLILLGGGAPLAGGGAIGVGGGHYSQDQAIADAAA